MEKVVIRADRCKGCGLCVDACPKQCIAIGDSFNQTGYRPAILSKPDACISCGFCYQVCPDVCIEIRK